jgi:hypothetical protein
MKKLFSSVFLTITLLLLSTGTVFAQDTTTPPITGTVESVTLETDATTGETVVIVTLTDELGATQTVNLSVETATSLGLVTTDATTGETTVIDTAVGSTIEIDPATVIGGEEEEDQHPVGGALADFFGETLGVDYDTIMEYHDEGAGFGVIAQALWITTRMDGDTALFQTIVDAKLSGDYSAITLEDGSIPENWGQFKKAILKGETGNSLGDVMSGKGDDEENGKGKPEKDHGNGNGNGNGNGGNGGGNGNGNGNGNGGNGGGNGNGNGNGNGD